MAAPATYEELERVFLSKDGPQYELVGGELVERTVSTDSSETAAWISALLLLHVRKHGLGKIFELELGIRIFQDAEDVRRADISFISASRAPRVNSDFLRIAPDLVVEVVSPSDVASKLRQKVDLWLDNGVRLVWVVYPEEREVHVYRANGPASILGPDAEITAEDVIPGFAVTVRDLFPD